MKNLIVVWQQGRIKKKKILFPNFCLLHGGAYFWKHESCSTAVCEQCRKTLDIGNINKAEQKTFSSSPYLLVLLLTSYNTINEMLRAHDVRGY